MDSSDARHLSYSDTGKKKTLLELPVNHTAKIVEISGGKGSRQLLAQLGIGVGSLITVRRNAPFAGPVLVENHGVSVAIGRGVAAKILVEEV
ncbi:MAG: FeoA domain-containing protein [Calditrichia bacterium]